MKHLILLLIVLTSLTASAGVCFTCTISEDGVLLLGAETPPMEYRKWLRSDGGEFIYLASGTVEPPSVKQWKGKTYYEVGFDNVVPYLSEATELYDPYFKCVNTDYVSDVICDLPRVQWMLVEVAGR